VLPPDFGVVSYYFPPHDIFLVLIEPLDLLLDSEQLLLFSRFIFGGFFLPVL
jgi:hypothetical protein